MALLEWVLFQTIVGSVIIGAIIYGVAHVLKAVLPKIPNPAFLAIPATLLAIFTLPSIPRYQFEARVLHEIGGKPWLRVTNRTQWGDLTEPLTWFRTPIGALTVVMPDEAPGSDRFREIIFRYGESSIVSLVEPDCEDVLILYESVRKH